MVMTWQGRRPTRWAPIAPRAGDLPRTGWPVHQDHPLPQSGQAAHHHRYAKLVEVGDLIGDQAQREAHRAPLLEDVDPKSGRASPVEGEVQVTLRLKAGP